MKTHQFQVITPAIKGNENLREPQRQAYASIKDHFAGTFPEREVALVLPVGCGKSGLIAIVPFAVGARRALVVAPGVRIAKQLFEDFDPTHPKYFYKKRAVLAGPEYPEPAEIRSAKTNRTDLDSADVVITNIHQLQGSENKWLQQLPADYFDLILVDEGHHNVAESWETLRERFPEARIVNFSATPARADGQMMTGKIIYSYPVCEAIKLGFIKKLKAVVLNPETLQYVRREDGNEIEVTLEEVRKLGEEDADFRRSIVSSKKTLATIVDCSIRELRRLRNETSDDRHKIIASALNYGHCIQIVAAYEARGLRAAYIHSRETGSANDKILQKLENNEIDVIVQVRKLGEGFDHPYLSVAAVCSIFSNLSPFIQFVGRIMRSIVPNDPNNPLNNGVVVFHAGANVARRWSDFQTYSKADQEYFDQLLSIEEFNFKQTDEIELTPDPLGVHHNTVEIRNQTQVRMQEIPLLEDEEAKRAIEILIKKGYSPEQVTQAMLEPIPTTKQKLRLASKKELDSMVVNAAGKILNENRINPKGKTLDKIKPPRENFVVVKSAIDKKINALVGRKERERQEFSQAQLDLASQELPRLIQEIAQEVLNG